MNRRQVLGGASAVLFSSGSGCLGGVFDPGTATNASPDGPKPERREYPDHPESIASETVVAFVEEYEAAEYHNQLLESGDRRPDSLSAGCDAAIDRRVNGDFYVVSTCYGSSRTDDVVSEFASDPRIYRVDEIGFQRLAVERVDRSGYYPLYACNFTGTEHELHVAIRSGADSDSGSGDGAGASDPVLEDARTLDGETGLEVPFGSDTASGAYELVVRAEDSTVTREWEIRNEFTGIGLYVTPDGTIDVDALPDRSQW